MKNPTLTFFFATLGAASSVLLPVFNAAGQTTVATNPVGYLQTSCLSNSDTLVAPPFTRSAAFTGAVSTVSGSVFNFSSSVLTADQFDAPTTTPPAKDTYYLIVGPATATLTGTVSVTSGVATVMGTGTSFTTQLVVGDRLTINDGYNLLTYTVAAIGSATSLTLDRPFADSAATGSTSSAAVSKPVATKATGRTVAAPNATTTSATTLNGLAATFDHSPYEGRFYQVVSNTANSVTVNLNNDTPAPAVGTQVSIIPFWTLNSIFPATDAGVSFTPTTDFRTKTQVFIPDYASVGTNQSPAATYIFYSNSSNVGWRLFSDLVTDQGYIPLLPDGYITVRNPSNSPTLPVTFYGTVPTNKLVTMLASNTSQSQDNAVALNRPADATLNSLGLSPTDGSFQQTVDFRTKDQLFVYDNTKVGINKSPSATFIYYNDGTNIGWRLFADLTTDQGGTVVPAGSALVVRKAKTTVAQTVPWTNSPNY